VLGAVQAFADFKKGDVFGGVIGTGSAALAIGGALGVVPGGAALSLAVFGAQSIYSAIKNEKTQNEREDELKELIKLTDLKNLKPEVLDLLTHDGDPWRLRDLTQAAKASGQNPKESLEYLNELSEDELKLLDQRLETQKGIGESKQEKLTPSDTALLKRRYGPDAVITETNRQLERKDLSEQERADLENLKEFAERAKATRGHGTGPDGEALPDSELLTGYPFQSKEGLGLDLMYRGFFEPPFQQAH
jgi:hypothetical protein